MNRCPTDELIMQKFDYTNNFTRASVTFLAHKFPHTSSIYYQCNVRLCVNASGGCSQTNCPNSLVHGSQRRRKRSSVNELTTPESAYNTVLSPSLSGGSSGHSVTKIPELSFDVYSGLHVEDLDNDGK